MDFPSSRLPVPPVLTPFHIDSLGMPWYGGNNTLGAAASTAWPTANLALYYPFRLTDWGTARQLLLWVGAASAGDIDVGIYDSQKHRLVSAGTTAMSATVNTVQELNITDTVLAPGLYMLGVVSSKGDGTATVFAQNPSDELVLPGIPIYEEALGSASLPATATPVVSTLAGPYMVAAGIQFASAF